MLWIYILVLNELDAVRSPNDKLLAATLAASRLENYLQNAFTKLLAAQNFLTELNSHRKTQKEKLDALYRSDDAVAIADHIKTM